MSKIEFKLPLAGAINATVTIVSGPEHAYLEFEGVVNGVEQTGSMHLKHYPEGWALDRTNCSEYNALHFHNRWIGGKYVDASDATRRKVKAAILPVFQAYMDEHPEVLAAADHDARKQAVRKAFAAVEKQREALNLAEASYAAALANLAKLGKGTDCDA